MSRKTKVKETYRVEVYSYEIICYKNRLRCDIERKLCVF